MINKKKRKAIISVCTLYLEIYTEGNRGLEDIMSKRNGHRVSEDLPYSFLMVFAGMRIYYFRSSSITLSPYGL